MLKRTELWAQILAAQGAIVQNLSPKLQPALQDSIFNGVQGWFHLGLAYYIRPDAMTVERIQQRNPYTHRDVLAQHVQNLHDADFLDANGTITQSAYDAYQGLIDTQNAIASQLDNMPENKLNQVADYLTRAYEAAQKLDAPCLKDVSTTALPDNAVHRIYYLAYRFAALRDDAHLQAWRHLDVEGHTYEAASLVWDGTATHAAKFMEVRQNRGYDEADWQATLDKLVDKGWLLKHGEAYAASDAYQTLRQDIEDKTNAFFYQAFEVLSDEEVNALFALLKMIQESFTPEPQST